MNLSLIVTHGLALIGPSSSKRQGKKMLKNFAKLGSLVLALIVTSSLVPSQADAKDMRQRLGLGIKNNNSFDLPALAGVYYAASEVAITGGLGMDTQKDNSKFALTGGVRRMIFFEEHMNFYFGGSLSLVNIETNADKQNGWELNALFGTEFYLAGLENLALTFEGGAGVVSMREVRFRTIADHPFRAGILFYF